MTLPMTLQDQFGHIDIYLFDQILRGNITPRMRILDAGCGFGRNLVYLLRESADIHALDQSPEAVAHVQALAASLGRMVNATVAPIESMPFEDATFEAVLSNSVLHFARDEAHFRAMLLELWRVLAPGGLLFLRLGSRIGMDFERIGPNIFRTGDGSAWFLVDEDMLLDLTEELDAVQVDPLKTTVVQDHRCMTTWVLRKRHARPL